MSSKANGNVVSLDGSRVLYHPEELPWKAAQGEGHTEEVDAHITTHLGPITGVFQEIYSDTVRIDINFVAPTQDFPYLRLLSSGMSELPMQTPEDIIDAPRYSELLLTLPDPVRRPVQPSITPVRPQEQITHKRHERLVRFPSPFVRQTSI